MSCFGNVKKLALSLNRLFTEVYKSINNQCIIDVDSP